MYIYTFCFIYAPLDPATFGHSNLQSQKLPMYTGPWHPLGADVVFQGLDIQTPAEKVVGFPKVYLKTLS